MGTMRTTNAEETAPMDGTPRPSNAPHEEPHHGEDEAFDPKPHRPGSRGLAVVGLLGAGVLVALVAVGVIPRMAHKAADAKDEARIAGESAHVKVVHPVRGGDGNGVLLPGSIEPVQEATVYARTSGYVRSYKVDIGDTVKEGQLLAELDTPEVDQELRQTQASAGQARAVVQQAATQRELARTTVERYAALTPQGVTSKQDLDEKQATFAAQSANVNAAEASVKSADANVRRLGELKSFGRVVAPFDGVVTSRAVEMGQLVTAGSGAGQAMFKIAKLDVVRVYVNVPQLYAGSVKVGQETQVTVREVPGHPFKGTIARTARALDPATRTLLTEIRVPNADGSLLGGMYAQAKIDVKRADARLIVPATAVRVTGEGTRVAVVEGGVITWKVVTIEADLGDQMSISDGLRESDLVVTMPSEKLGEGLKVQTDEPKKS